MKQKQKYGVDSQVQKRKMENGKERKININNNLQ